MSNVNHFLSFYIATESTTSSIDRVQGAPSNSQQTIGFSMAVTILVIVVLLLVVLVIVLIVRKAKNSKEVPLKGIYMQGKLVNR